MTNINIKYNPYTVESEIKIDGNVVQPPNKLADFATERLQSWVENLIPILNEVCNDDEYQIEFYGTSLDYDDLAVCVNDYCERNKDVAVTLSFTEAKGAADRFNELIDLFNDMQKNCPFEDLKTQQIKENFNSVVSSEFEVSVIATMSSGKSTLINALLGRELMPSKNQACTATIAKIKDVDEMDHFEAVYYDKQKNELGKYTDLSLEDMSEMNDNPETAYIDIEGDVPNIESNNVQLVLVDTPGPNNSRTEEHKNHTYRVIKEKAKPMVLYVLNGTQLQINDDEELLTVVSEAMKVGGKQSKDRFLFAVNKMDEFDPDKESVQGTIENVKEYLRKFDIENPNIFPTSAETAKLIRMSRSGQILTSKQKRTLRDCDLFVEDEQLHLSEQATLSKENMRKIKEEIRKAQEEDDIEEEALIHTGIPAIELAIDEYLKKYAYTTKVKTAVDTFRKKVEEKDIHAKMLSSIQDDEEARASINNQLKIIKEQLEDGAEGQKFREKINNLDMTKDAEKKIQKIRTEISKIAKNKYNKKEMTMLEVSQMMANLDRTIREMQSRVKVELENIIEDVICNCGKEIVEDYRTHIHSLISSGELQTGTYDDTKKIEFLEEAVPDAQELVDKFKYVKEVDTGERETVKNYNHKWWDLLELFEPRTVTKKIFEDVEMVDAGKVYDEYISPIINGFEKNIDNAKSTAAVQANEFKQFFMKELDSLEEILKKKVEEDEKLTRDQESITKKIKEDQQKVKWLEEFLKRLDTILAI